MDPNDQNSQDPMDGGQTPPPMPSGDTGMGGDTGAPQGDTPMPSTPPPVGDTEGGTEPEIAPPTPAPAPEEGTGGGGADSSGQPA
jgi:hypothetical protein